MMKPVIPKFMGLSALLSIVTLMVLGLMSPDTWAAMRPATCLETGCFCEAVSTQQPIRQPANTVSSLAFAVIGVWVLSVSRPAAPAHPFGRAHRVMFGVSALVIGLGSAFYHASMTFAGQFFDILGMYLLTGLMWVYALQRIGGCATSVAALIYLALNLGLTVVQIEIPETRRFVFGLLLMLALLSEVWVWQRVRPARRYGWLWAGLSVFGLAYAVWMLDDSHAWCEPHSWLQGHALWHVLGAVAVYALWRWYTSEPAPNASA